MARALYVLKERRHFGKHVSEGKIIGRFKTAKGALRRVRRMVADHAATYGFNAYREYSLYLYENQFLVLSVDEYGRDHGEWA